MAVLRQIFSCCILFIIFYNPTETLANDIYTNTWAVKVRGSIQEAKKLASKHGFSYVKHLFEDYHLYKRPELKGRLIKTHTSDKFDRKLGLDSKIEWFMQQKEMKYLLLSLNFNDPLYKDQWYISRPAQPTFNVTSVWPEYTGNGILVAVVDDGVDGNHLELSNNYNSWASYDFLENDKIPAPSGKIVTGFQYSQVNLTQA